MAVSCASACGVPLPSPLAFCARPPRTPAPRGASPCPEKGSDGRCPRPLLPTQSASTCRWCSRCAPPSCSSLGFSGSPAGWAPSPGACPQQPRSLAPLLLPARRPQPPALLPAAAATLPELHTLSAYKPHSAEASPSCPIGSSCAPLWAAPPPALHRLLAHRHRQKTPHLTHLSCVPGRPPGPSLALQGAAPPAECVQPGGAGAPGQGHTGHLPTQLLAPPVGALRVSARMHTDGGAARCRRRQCGLCCRHC